MHRSARSSRTRVSSSPPSAPEVAIASPTSPSQAASSSLVSTAIYTSSVSTPQLVASTLASTSSALPGIPPVAPKIVAAIVSGEFIELASLLEDRIELEPPSFTLIADQLVIRPKKRRKAITDILSWMQAFAVYTLVVTAYYPARVADLLKYQLLIMRTAQQFYDRAFRRQAAAYKLTDWSQLNPELFHFYVSGCVSVEHHTVAPPVQSVSPTKPSRPADVMEASGTPSSSTLCHFWKASRCSSQFLRCRFRHSCDFPGCSALHRRVVAHRKTANSPAPEPPFKRRRPSDA